MTIINDIKFNWTEYKTQSTRLFYKGCEETAYGLLNILNNNNSLDQLDYFFKKNQDFSSGIIEDEDVLIAWVDHIRSWPIFYLLTADNNFTCSNNARDLNGKNIDDLSCLEFVMSGYVTGDHTLYQDIKALQPGEFLIWDKAQQSLQITRYYQYQPVMTNPASWKDNRQKMGVIIDNLTQKVIERAQNRPIWIPLSGGLDSRILLCKLHEHGYKNIHTFTYGPTFNFESKIAKKVAQKLDVPWHFISPSKKQIRKYFNSQDRKDFWYTTDGYKAIASMREFSALMHLRHKKLIPDDAIIINGQSGDYITGNHISKCWTENREFTPDELLDVIYKKHYGLWNNLKTKENYERIKERIINLLPKDWKDAKSGIEYATLEEIWEYDGRQVCLVANGQKSYDYFSYDWEMPLWEKALVDFCETLPLDQKIGQSLYKDYLKNYDYKGLFSTKEPYIWRWPFPMLWVIPAAQIIKLFKGKKAKNYFYNLMRYHGHYSNQFYSFSWKTHRKTYLNTRNVMSLNIRQWVIENKYLFPTYILNALGVNNVD